MDIQLSTGQKAFAKEAIRTGRLQREEEAVREALDLWESRERQRAEVLSALDAAARFYLLALNPRMAAVATTIFASEFAAFQ